MRIGIVGCGLIGQKRASSAIGSEIVCVHDVNPERALALAAGHGAVAVADWHDLLRANLDAILVATPHNALSDIALAAVETGHHVLVEKPAGRTAAEVARLVEAARANDRIIKVGFNHRFHPALQKAKALVEAGELGPLMYIRGRYGHGGRIGMEQEWRCNPDLSGGGELIDQAPHLIDLSRWFLGDLTLEYGAAPTFFWNVPIDDNCFLALRAPSGQMAWLHATWTEWKNMFSFEITGRDGKLVIEGLGGSYGVERLNFYKMRPEMGPPETTMWEYPFPDSSWSAEYRDFAEAARLGRRANGDIEDAYEVLKIVDKTYGRSVT